MAELDLTAERAKRSRETKTLVMKDDDGAIISKYEMAAEFPAMALDLAVEGKLGAALRELFVDPVEAAEFISKHKPSVDDLKAIMSGAYGLSGMGDDMGESSASGG